MKYLFIVQGEGRGHLTQSLALRKMLVAHGHEVVAVMVGRSKQRSIPGFYTDNIQTEVLGFKSPNFLPSNRFKRIPFVFSLLYNLFYLPQYFDSMLFIRRTIKEHQPDVVVNFYELLCGLTYGIFRPSVPMVSIAHQYFFLTDEFRYEGRNKAGFFMLNFFSRLTAWNSSKKLALSFHPVKNGVAPTIRFVPPLLREEVLNIGPQNGNYIHGYLLNSIYAEELKVWSRQHPDEELHFFWDKRNVNDTERLTRQLYLHTLDDKLFLYFMARSKGYATTAGFESVCEALYLGKPVLMIPTHIEQECNALDATRAGAGVSSTGFDLSRLLAALPDYQPSTAFREWVMRAEYDFLAELTEVECVRGWAFI